MGGVFFKRECACVCVRERVCVGGGGVYVCVCERERETYFPQITQTHVDFENNSNFDKLPYLLGEIPQCAITAA